MSWKGSVFIGKKRILFIGDATEAEAHSLHAIKICAVLNGKFSSSTSSKSNSYSAAIIDADTEHSMDCQGTKLTLLLYLLPETRESREIKHVYLGQNNPSEIDYLATRLPQLGAFQNHWDWKPEYAHEVCGNIVGELIESPSPSLSEEVDPHARRIINYLYSEVEKQRKEPEFDKGRFEPLVIMNELKLYEIVGWHTVTKLMDSFKRETGVTLDDYFDTLRLRAASEKLGVDPKKRTTRYLTDVAESVGFNLRLLEIKFKEMLGINPRALRHSSRFVQLAEEEEG